uniref:Uncharacterized protein n=1 Tax=Cucumis melo TaxID=3656 RepID=A0A9I9EEN1_CUCME
MHPSRAPRMFVIDDWDESAEGFFVNRDLASKIRKTTDRDGRLHQKETEERLFLMMVELIQYCVRCSNDDGADMSCCYIFVSPLFHRMVLRSVIMRSKAYNSIAIQEGRAQLSQRRQYWPNWVTKILVLFFSTILLAVMIVIDFRFN